eukprot:scaffold15292_cov18-Tisochrysis_lutea.AAC.2
MLSFVTAQLLACMAAVAGTVGCVQEADKGKRFVTRICARQAFKLPAQLPFLTPWTLVCRKLTRESCCPAS